MESVGLTQRRAAEILRESGRNVLPHVTGVPTWRLLLSQFWHLFALMLWVAAGLAWLGGMPELSVAIVLVVVVNGLFAFAQEYRAERAAARLRDLMPHRSTVIRDGRAVVVDAAEVVTGDVLVLTEGDRVPADALCATSSGLRVDTSVLTGESVPESVVVGAEVLAGTFVVAGEGRASVRATAGDTRFAQIARLTAGGQRPRTPLERDMHRLVQIVALIAASVGVVFFAVMLLLGASASAGFLFGIGVTVALVPEGLLPTVTLSLAIGAQRMAAQNALVRRLESVETLGATTVICTDKTGTLTQNRMNVVAAWTPAGEARINGQGYEPHAEVSDAGPHIVQLARAARTASQGSIRQVGDEWLAHGDPMDAAVDALARRLGLPANREGRSEPFDPAHRMAFGQDRGRVFCKGAPEAVLAVCDPEAPDVEQALHGYAVRGLRVLAVAVGENRSTMRLLGLLAFEDPPRPGVAEMVAQCRRAGIKLIMITGDHPKTARAIAEEIGLALPGSPVRTYKGLAAADIDHDGLVLARVRAEDKLHIAQALQSRGHVVAMTGDGVNDAPALRCADIGVAMGAGGTDVAREAADLVLLDDHFATIVAAVIQGRGTFINARRFLTYHLTDNVAELTPFVVWAASGGSVPLALGVLQILALDLGTDTLPAIALGAERPDERVLAHGPVRGGLLDRTVATRAFAVLGPTEAVMEMLAFLVVLVGAGWTLGGTIGTDASMAASGAAFLTVVVMQAANVFACRGSRHPVWRLPWLSNRYMLVAVVASLLFGVACLTVPSIDALLGGTWPPVVAVLLAALGVPALWLADAGGKALARVHMTRFGHGRGDRAQVSRRQ